MIESKCKINLRSSAAKRKWERDKNCTKILAMRGWSWWRNGCQFRWCKGVCLQFLKFKTRNDPILSVKYYDFSIIKVYRHLFDMLKIENIHRQYCVTSFFNGQKIAGNVFDAVKIAQIRWQSLEKIKELVSGEGLRLSSVPPGHFCSLFHTLPTLLCNLFNNLSILVKVLWFYQVLSTLWYQQTLQNHRLWYLGAQNIYRNIANVSVQFGPNSPAIFAHQNQKVPNTRCHRLLFSCSFIQTNIWLIFVKTPLVPPADQSHIFYTSVHLKFTFKLPYFKTSMSSCHYVFGHIILYFHAQLKADKIPEIGSFKHVIKGDNSLKFPVEILSFLIPRMKQKQRNQLLQREKSAVFISISVCRWRQTRHLILNQFELTDWVFS